MRGTIKTCPTCGGAGERVIGQDAEGTRQSERCERCQGDGVIENCCPFVGCYGEVMNGHHCTNGHLLLREEGL